MLLPSTPDEVLPWSMEGREAQSLCVKLVDCVLAEGEKYAEKTKNGALDPHEEGINRAEKIRRMQKQPVAMDFPKSDVQLGKTKVFMRKHPHDCLEAHRVFHQNATATLIQSWARSLEQERKYLVTEYSVQLIQRFYRGCKGRERYVNNLVSKLKYCINISDAIFFIFLLKPLAGGLCARQWRVCCSRRCFGCLSSGENSTARKKERFDTKHSFVDTMLGESWQQSRYRNITGSSSRASTISCSSLLLLRFSAQLVLE